MMEYDKDYVQKYREKAITKREDLHVGETYYSNHYGKILVKRFLTNAQSWADIGIKDAHHDPDTIGWFEIKVADWEHHRQGRGTVVSLLDNNIGASYNPWLIFADEKTMEEYKKDLVIRFEYDPLLDDAADIPYDDDGSDLFDASIAQR